MYMYLKSVDLDSRQYQFHRYVSVQTFSVNLVYLNPNLYDCKAAKMNSVQINISVVMQNIYIIIILNQ